MFPNPGAPLQLQEMRNGKVHLGTAVFPGHRGYLCSRQGSGLRESATGMGKDVAKPDSDLEYPLLYFPVCWKCSDLRLCCRELTIKIFFNTYVDNFLPSPWPIRGPSSFTKSRQCNVPCSALGHKVVLSLSVWSRRAGGGQFPKLR